MGILLLLHIAHNYCCAQLLLHTIIAAHNYCYKQTNIVAIVAILQWKIWWWNIIFLSLSVACLQNLLQSPTPLEKWWWVVECKIILTYKLSNDRAEQYSFPIRTITTLSISSSPPRLIATQASFVFWPHIAIRTF